MGDLVSRQEVKKELAAEYNRRFMAGDRGGLKMAWIEKAVDDVPSAQVERKKGKWKEETRRTVHGYDFPISICSECGKMAVDEYNFCPNCGADMRGDNEGDD